MRARACVRVRAVVTDELGIPLSQGLKAAYIVIICFSVVVSFLNFAFRLVSTLGTPNVLVPTGHVAGRTTDRTTGRT